MGVIKRKKVYLFIRNNLANNRLDDKLCTVLRHLIINLMKFH